MRITIVWCCYLTLCAVTVVYAAPRFDPNTLGLWSRASPSTPSESIELPDPKRRSNSSPVLGGGTPQESPDASLSGGGAPQPSPLMPAFQRISPQKRSGRTMEVKVMIKDTTVSRGMTFEIQRMITSTLYTESRWDPSVEWKVSGGGDETFATSAAPSRTRFEFKGDGHEGFGEVLADPVSTQGIVRTTTAAEAPFLSYEYKDKDESKLWCEFQEAFKKWKKVRGSM
ncbi:hypothetical protein C8R41DRAFT_866530 [Lentinula lateritia]|uniref:Secreted protein n=1 Tax=Lentinula lateritia TaxID=40482 RepID=A0ABQ8VLB2_9AGAR|nr:hypothetical protein C8R41DRAFT_866530 [Lentinula lateritia]